MERRPTRSSGPVVVGQPQSIPPAIPAKPKSLRSRLSMGVSKYASQTFEKLVTQTASPSRREETKDSNASAAASPSSAGSEVKEEPSPVSTTSSSSSSSTDSRPSDVDSPAMKAEVSEGKRDGAGLGAAPVDDAVAAPVAGPGFRRFDAVLSRVGLFQTLEDKSGIHKVYIAFFLIILLLVGTVYMMGIQQFSLTVAFVYPAYMTYKTLNTNSYDDHMHWLTYWVVFGVFDVFDGALDYLLYWLPYYELLKLIFLVWCFLPGTKGCAVIYKHLVRPVLRHNEAGLDGGIDWMGEKARQVGSEVTSVAMAVVNAIVVNAVRTMAATGLRVGNSAPSSSTTAATPADASASISPGGPSSSASAAAEQPGMLSVASAAAMEAIRRPSVAPGTSASAAGMQKKLS